MYSCDQYCYDYTSGHICKHIHRIHAFQKTEGEEVTVPPSLPEQTRDDLIDIEESNNIPIVSNGHSKANNANNCE